MLVFSAADFEDFLEPRPDLPASLETELKEVVSLLAANKWPFRLHATYDESITCFLNVFEEVASSTAWKNDPLVPWEQVAASATWVITSQLVMKSFGIALVLAVCAGITAWLLVAGLALIWWFILDKWRTPH